MAATLFLAPCVQTLAENSADKSTSTLVAKKLGDGINLAGALEAPREGQWGVKLRDDYFGAIQKAGFSTVRIPIRWSAHASLDAPYTVDPEFWTRMDWVVDETKAHHLNALLDFQNYDELMANPEAHKDRFLAIWRQIAEHYRNAPPTVLFELLNEPHNKLEAATWNDLLAQAITLIRPTNPTRIIVVGPVRWNKISALPLLILPAGDSHLLATIHYYDPMTFTHQGAPWEKTSLTWLGTKWIGTDAEKQVVDQDFDKALAWASSHRCPVFLGEFGTYEKCDIESRERWTNYIARSAAAHGMAWAYWEFCGNFGAYDPVINEWRAPLLQALRSR